MKPAGMLFVTGATGFVGRHFVMTALARGWSVRALVRDRTINRPELDGAERLVGELGAFSEEALEGCNTLVHFAASGVNPRSSGWDECFAVNVAASIKIWRAALNQGVRRIIVCGSCFEYGDTGAHYDAVPPNAPLLPGTAYAASKASASLAAHSLAIESGADIRILRLFHVFGPGEQANRFWPTLIAAARGGRDLDMTDGTQVRDFVHVAAAADRFVDELTCERIKPAGAFIDNVGSGVGISLREFAEYWWMRADAKGTLNFGRIPQRKGEGLRYVAATNQPIPARKYWETTSWPRQEG